MAVIDNGTRVNFDSGAFREIDHTKGRCDLVYNAVMGEVINDAILILIEQFVRTGDRECILEAMRQFICKNYEDPYTGYLELSIHYAEGASKYEERNYEKGLPLHCYIDSGLRHYIKHLREDTDERHDRAFLWNMASALYCVDFTPDFIDLPFAKKGE